METDFRKIMLENYFSKHYKWINYDIIFKQIASESNFFSPIQLYKNCNVGR